jgi:hypothetical protein
MCTDFEVKKEIPVQYSGQSSAGRPRFCSACVQMLKHSPNNLPPTFYYSNGCANQITPPKSPTQPYGERIGSQAKLHPSQWISAGFRPCDSGHAFG